jgi:hypothetical protein
VSGHAEAQGDGDVTDRTERFLQAFSLPTFTMDAQERRLVRGAAVLAAAAVWLSAALIDVWFLLVVPLLAVACAVAIARLRRRRPAVDDADDWSF